MESEQRASETRILVLPFMTQGHINPMLQLAKRLASKGLRVTLLTTSSTEVSLGAQKSTIHIESIFDGNLPKNAEEFKHFKTSVSQRLANLIEEHKSTMYPTKLIIYDSFIPWVLDVAKQLGVLGAPFFTQSWAVSTIYYHFQQGTLTMPLQGPVVSLPCLPVLQMNDLPSFIYDMNSYPGALDIIASQFSNLEEAYWILCNTFDKLEEEVIKWMSSQWPIKNIGPAIPSMYLDKRLEDDKDYGLSLFKPDIDGCMKWLDSREVGSVIYISFGSVAALGEEQMEEIAWGLKRSNYYFLWVVRESEVKKLPSNLLEEISDKGLVVNWSLQLEVLAHKAVGCFMTHCGWNSTLEALSLGVPMVAIPQWTDQPTNAKLVADVWQTGVRVKANEKGLVTKEEIEECVREVMEGEKGDEMRRNSNKWKKLAKEAVDEGGSSYNNIEEFVAKLISN